MSSSKNIMPFQEGFHYRMALKGLVGFKQDFFLVEGGGGGEYVQEKNKNNCHIQNGKLGGGGGGEGWLRGDLRAPLPLWEHQLRNTSF